MQVNAAVQDQDRIISKIQKLLNLANDKADGGEHERDNALRQALNLLAKHNLSMADLETEKEDRESVEIEEEFPEPFRRTIADAISKLFFCAFYSSKVKDKQKYKFTFVGLESNAITAKEMTAYLIRSVSKEGIRLRREQNESVAFDTSFRNAAAGRISARCDALRAEAEQEQATSGSTAIVLASLYDQEATLNAKYIKDIIGVELTLKKTRPEIKSSKGARLGREFGDKVNLNRQISAPPVKSPVLQLGVNP